MITPSLNAITLFFIAFTIWSSCVDTIIVFHSLLRVSNRCIISWAFFLSRLPVGSSPMIIEGWWISALAIQVRCISQPESVSTNLFCFSSRPTSDNTSGTLLMIVFLSYQQTSIANATFSRTVFLESNLKSWNIIHIFLRYFKRSELLRELISCHLSS